MSRIPADLRYLTESIAVTEGWIPRNTEDRAKNIYAAIFDGDQRVTAWRIKTPGVMRELKAEAARFVGREIRTHREPRETPSPKQKPHGAYALSDGILRGRS